jgi:hypothetical protein
MVPDWRDLPTDPSRIAWGLGGHTHQVRSRAPSDEETWPSLVLAFLSTITKYGGFKSISDNGARNAYWYFLAPSLSPNYKSTSTKTSAETPNFSNLSPYNPGSQLKSRRISNQPDYNQDRIIQHNTSHVTFHKYLREAYNPTESQLLQTRFWKQRKHKLHTHLVKIWLPVLQITFPQKH